MGMRLTWGLLQGQRKGTRMVLIATQRKLLKVCNKTIAVIYKSVGRGC